MKTLEVKYAWRYIPTGHFVSFKDDSPIVSLTVEYDAFCGVGSSQEAYQMMDNKRFPNGERVDMNNFELMKATTEYSHKFSK